MSKMSLTMKNYNAVQPRNTVCFNVRVLWDSHGLTQQTSSRVSDHGGIHSVGDLSTSLVPDWWHWEKYVLSYQSESVLWFFVPSSWQAHEWSSVSPPFTAYGTIHSQALSEMPARIIRIFFLNASVFLETFWTISERCQHRPFSEWLPHRPFLFCFSSFFPPKTARHRTMPFLSRLSHIPF